MIGTEGPVAIFWGTCTFTCKSPATDPGDPPAYCTCALRPPTVAVTVSTGTGAGASAGFPSMPPGLVCPSPVAYTEIKDPSAAGLLAEFTVPFWFKIAPCPTPDASIVKIPGAVYVTGIATTFEFCPWYVT